MPPENPCFCGSGKMLKDCHLQDGQITVSPSRITPHLPITNYSHRKCLLSVYNDCDKKISGEHILSASILRAIALGDDSITIEGTGYKRRVPIKSKSLTTKKLCRRHNSAFSPLDKEAGHLLEAFQAIYRSFEIPEDNPQKVYLFSGHDIERWLLKTLLFTFYGATTRITKSTHSLDPRLTTHFYKDNWPSRHGLYFRTAHENGKPFEAKIEHRTAISLVTSGNTVVGMRLSLIGLQFLLIVDGSYRDIQKYTQSYTYRPSFLCFRSDDEYRAIGFVWNNHEGDVVAICKEDPDVVMPDVVII